MQEFKLFQRLCSFPFALVLVAFLFPLVSFSCAERVVAEPNAYQLAMGVKPLSLLEEKERAALADMSEKEPQVSEFFNQRLQTAPILVPIIVAVVLAGVFAFFSPVGSLAMGLAALVSLWVFIYRLPSTLQSQNYDFLTVKPAVGAYCASMLILVGIAMSLAAIIKYHRLMKQMKAHPELQQDSSALPKK
ncbi:MAG: hypothetical protein M0P13_09615 [Fibrobacteraceae bacterium]|nr:hypothetical protein [Fibrobacteraceae bacterium]